MQKFNTQQMNEAVNEAYEKFRGDDGGKNADYIPFLANVPSQLFGNVRRRAAADPNLNETLSNIFHAIENSAKGAASEEDMKGLFADIDVNSTTSTTVIRETLMELMV